MFFARAWAAEARVVCQRIVEQAAGHDWRRLCGELKVTVSIGVAAGDVEGKFDHLLAAAGVRL